MEAEYAKKASEMKLVKKKVEELRKRNIRGLSPTLNSLEVKWKRIEGAMKAIKEDEKRKIAKEKETAEKVKKENEVAIQKEAIKAKEDLLTKDNEDCPPILRPKPIVAKKEMGMAPPEFVMRVNKLREQVATISKALGSSEDVFVSRLDEHIVS